MTEKDTNPKDALGAAKWRQFMTVPRQVLWELGVAMLEGALKYGRHNYRASGVRASVYLDAAYGHLDQFCEGEDIDKDSGLSHVTKAMASLAVLRDAMMNDFWVDDRPPKIGDLDGTRDRLQALVAENFERYADKDPHHYTHASDGAPYMGVAKKEELVVKIDAADAIARVRSELDRFERDFEAVDVEEEIAVQSTKRVGQVEVRETIYKGGLVGERGAEAVVAPDAAAHASKKRILQASLAEGDKTMGLTEQAIALIEEWMSVEYGRTFAIDVPFVSKAIACKQWASMNGLL